jgi:glycosyltransferase involved in cell wall biosynthesis
VVQRLRSTLVVTTFNWPAALDLTLRSIARQSVPPGEVIVADDGSGPETVKVVERWQSEIAAPVQHLWQPHEGFRLARSRNRAIAAANGEYLIIVDGDMVLHRHFIADHLNAARRGSFIQGVRLLTEADAAARMLRDGCMDLGFFASAAGGTRFVTLL